MSEELKNIETEATEVSSNEISLESVDKMSTATEKAPEMSLKRIAETAHEVVGAYTVGLGGQHIPFRELSEEEVNITLESVKLLLDSSNRSASAVHDFWIANMISSGWVYGEVYSEEDKTHPLMLDYRNLPKEERTKDKLFSLVVKSF